MLDRCDRHGLIPLKWAAAMLLSGVTSDSRAETVRAECEAVIRREVGASESDSAGRDPSRRVARESLRIRANTVRSAPLLLECSAESGSTPIGGGATVTPGYSATMTNTSEELDSAVAAATQGDRAALALVLENIRPLVVRYCRARSVLRRGDNSPRTTWHKKCASP